MAVIRALFALAIFGLGAWAALALYFGPLASSVGAGVVAVSGVLAAASAARRRGSWAPIGLFAVIFAGFLWVWSGVTPSNARKWQSDVAVLPYATFDGDLVTLHNIRNFQYWTELDYTPSYYTKTFDLNQLDEVDMIAVYWMGDAIAHIMMSFGFADKDFVTISIETRKEEGESYDTVRGFFRNYELIYVVGDDRDLIRLRSNYRKNPPEDVYLYRSRIPPANARRLFLEYLRNVNELKEHPAFYNTGTTNCTTNIYRHTLVNPGEHPFSWKLMLSGYAPEYLYERGGLDSAVPFAEQKKRAHINPAAQAADKAEDFSQRIRANLPKLPPLLSAGAPVPEPAAIPAPPVPAEAPAAAPAPADAPAGAPAPPAPPE